MLCLGYCFTCGDRLLHVKRISLKQSVAKLFQFNGIKWFPYMSYKLMVLVLKKMVWNVFVLVLNHALGSRFICANIKQSFKIPWSESVCFATTAVQLYHESKGPYILWRCCTHLRWSSSDLLLGTFSRLKKWLLEKTVIEITNYDALIQRDHSLNLD